jgi:hypothetical protein
LGITQNLVSGEITSSQKTPSTLEYTGNVVLSAAAHHGIVPYVTGGIGGLMMFQNTGLAINSNSASCS